MALIRVNTCCGPRQMDNNFFLTEAQAIGEVIITAEEHGLGKVPQINVYDLDGNEFEPEVQVDDVTFEVTVRQEAPAIAFIIVMN